VVSGSITNSTVVLQVQDLGRWSPQAKAYVVAAGHYTLHAQGCAGTLWDGWLQGTQGEPFDHGASVPANRWDCATTQSLKLTVQ
jgi:hypothetical protein